MNCPKCVGALHRENVEKVEIDICFICEGIWFDAGELEKIIAADSRDFNKIDLGREMLDGEELKQAAIDLDMKEGKCPRCETLMEQKAYKKDDKVRIDVCPKGCGVWFDGGEIHEVRNRWLVNFKDTVENICDMLKFAYSKEGWKAFQKIVREEGFVGALTNKPQKNDNNN